MGWSVCDILFNCQFITLSVRYFNERVMKMVRERTNMRKTREILRQHFECGLSIRQISRSIAVSPTTVSNVIKAATTAKLVWPVAEMPDTELEALLFTVPGTEDQRALPDFTTLTKELKKKHVTLQLLCRAI